MLELPVHFECLSRNYASKKHNAQREINRTLSIPVERENETQFEERLEIMILLRRKARLKKKHTQGEQDKCDDSTR